jgi:hypothetical protein
MLQYSPKIVTDSLVMCLDPSQNKSYPTTDLPVKGGLALWLDASDDSTFSYSSGTSVSQWRDKSGNNRHFFQATAGNQPSRSAVVNSRKAIQFTAASSQYLRYNSKIINNTTGGSVFVAWRTAGETGAYSSILDNYHCGSNALGAGFQIERNVTNNQYYWGFQTSGCSNAGFIPATSYSNDTTNSVWITKDSTTITGGLNGTSVTPSSSPSATWIEDDKGWTIGAWGGGTESFGRFFNGINCEVIIFNRGLSPTEVKQINTYLGQKWGISNTDRSIVDLSGFDDNGLLGDGTTANMPAFDYYNKGSLKFDGSNDYINIGNPSSVNFGNGDFTIEMWMTRNTNATTNLRVLGKGAESDVAGSAGYAFFGSDGGINFGVNPGAARTIISAATYSLGEWFHVVGVVQRGSTMRTYKNGVLVSSAAAPTGSVSNASINLNIGRSTESASLYWPGNIAIVRMYNKALSVNEVLQNYEAQKTRFINYIATNGLVLNLDAGNIYSYAGAGTVWYDVSGNSYNGTLIGSPSYTSTNNGGIIFDSNAKYGTLPTSGLAFGTGQFAIEAWVFSTAAVTNNVIYASQSSNVAGFIALYYPNGSGFALTDFNAVGVRTTTTHQTAVSQNTWYHVVGIRNASNQYIVYVNGVVSTTNATSSATLSASAPQIASNPATTGERFTGTMGSLRLYNTSLSAAQVLQNYNATKGRFGL